MLHVTTDVVRLRPVAFPGQPALQVLDTTCGPLEVATWGPDTGPALILIHHGMGSWLSLQHIGSQLAAQAPGRRIISWSRPGCGDSPFMTNIESTDPLVYEAGTVLPALMATLRITTADFLGHSDGATVAMIFASLFPEGVGRIVAIAPYAIADKQFIADTGALPVRERDSGLSLRLGAHHADPEATYLRWRQRRMQDIGRQWSALSLLSMLTAPLLLIQGTDDEYANPVQMRAIADAVSGPVDWVMIRNQGHFLLEDVPEQVTCLTGGHLAGRPTAVLRL
jgi:pimeloyl-ACP methyl ester carboxylesterase